jgi:hypothetical protein
MDKIFLLITKEQEKDGTFTELSRVELTQEEIELLKEAIRHYKSYYMGYSHTFNEWLETVEAKKSEELLRKLEGI